MSDEKPKGPVRSRSCTDLLCLFLFVAFLGGWAVVGYFGILLGDPQRLVHPKDSHGRLCGFDNNLKDKPYLFFFDLTRCANPTVLSTGCPTPQVCVSACPNETFIANSKSLVWNKEGDLAKKVICKDNVTADSTNVHDLISQGFCASWYIQSSPVAGRCIPVVGKLTDDLEMVVFKASDLPVPGQNVTVGRLVNASKILAQIINARQMVEFIFQDFASSWWLILIALAVAMVISFVWIVLMRFIAGFMVWLSIIAVFALQCFGCWYCFERYRSLKDVPGSNVSLTQIAFSTHLDSYLSLRETWLIFLITLAITVAINLLVLIFLRNRIRIAIALIGQGSKAVGHVMSTLVFPIFPWILQVLIIGYYVAVAVYLASVGNSSFKVAGLNQTGCSCQPYQDGGFCIPDAFKLTCKCPGAMCQFSDYEPNPHISRLQIYNVFGLFWGLFFVSAFGEMVLAGTFSAWYWAFNKPKDVPVFALSQSIFRTVRYHLGTIAFGSLIISMIRSIRVLLEYIDRKVRKYQDNCCSRFLMCCCKCCFWCLEKFMRFVNRNAYILCAVNGTNFCTSAKDAFSLLLRNSARVVVLDKVTEFLLFLGRMVVVGLVGIGSFYVFSGHFDILNNHIPELHYYFVPIVTTTLGAFFISSLFFSVYSMAIDTTFICFLEDCESNDGSPEKPYFMSKDLMQILNKKNKH